MIWNALHPCGVTNADIYQIQQGSREADAWAFQGADSAPMHAMSNGDSGQLPPDARNAAAAFTATEMQDARTLYDTPGGESAAMYVFGLAMHPVMDETSPAHTNYQNGNPIPWCGPSPFGCSQIFEHGDFPSSVEDLDALNHNPEAQELANVIIRYWFHVLTGRKMNQCH
jgi:hypothetical protein